MRIRALLLAAGALLLAACGLFRPRNIAYPDPTPPPNVVLIISDDHHWADFGFMGHETVQTPRIDQLAAESAVFANGYVPASLCRPSLATMISGLYPHQHGITGNDPPPGTPDRDAMLQFVAAMPTLPRLLAPLGYRSHQSGKWWEGHYARGGFTDGMTVNGEDGRHGDRGLAIGREGMGPVTDFIDAAVADEAPFFVWYAPFLPHTPHNPPERLLAKYRQEGRPEALAQYWAMIEWFDETVGALVDHLDARGVSENTLVLFAVDNGWIQRTEPMEGWRFQFMPKSKRSPYDGGLRTPIMVRWPGQVAPGPSDALASTIDLAPTVLAAAGLPPTPEMPGVDLLDLATGDATRAAVYGDVYAHDMVSLEAPTANLQYRWVREGAWKLIAPVDAPPELYLLAEDPHETTNRADEQPERVVHLQALLDAWWRPAEGAAVDGAGR